MFRVYEAAPPCAALHHLTCAPLSSQSGDHSACTQHLPPVEVATLFSESAVPTLSACTQHLPPVEVAALFLESPNVVANVEILHSRNIDLFLPLNSWEYRDVDRLIVLGFRV